MESKQEKTKRSFPPVIVRGCPDYDKARLRSVLEEILERTGLREHIRPGMRVAVKVNLVAAMRPEKGGTSHPDMVHALCGILHEMGAQVTVGDSPGGIFTHAYVNGVYRTCRMDRAVEGVAALNENFSVKDCVFPEAVSIRTFSYTAWLDEADLIISLSKLKTHAMMSMSCAVKNLFGTIPGTTKPEYHMRFPDPGAFADMLVDLNEYFRPALHLVDGILGMEGNGPTAGTPRQAGVLIAGVLISILTFGVASIF